VQSNSVNIIKTDYLSKVTHQIAIGRSDTNVIFSTASSFLYKFKDDIYLITNWHNVTGINPENGVPLSRHSGIPTVFIIYFRLKNEPGSALKTIINLYQDDDYQNPCWLEHPIFGNKVDVVAIKIEQKVEFHYSPINNADFETDIPPEVSDEAFILGYPFEDFRYLGLPIWKKASIATEPTVNEDQLPKLLVDTATRSGLSGSPVIFQRIGIHKLENGVITNNSIIGRIRGFLGIYSGRIGKGEIHAQLGIVWKGKVIEEIIKGGKYGKAEF
jgi:hypothetical protein